MRQWITETDLRRRLGQFRMGLVAAMRMELPAERRPARALVAGALPSHDTCTVDEEWDQAAALEDADDAETLRHMHAWVSDEDDAEPDDAGSYRFPHHGAGTDTCANVNAVRDALDGLEDADVPDDDREDIEAHLQAHLDDADEAEDDGDGDGDEGSDDDGEDEGETSTRGPLQLAGMDEPIRLQAGENLPTGEIPVGGVLILEGAPTGDGRFIVEDALTHRDLPLPIMANVDHGGDHFESRLVGQIQTLSRNASGEWEFAGVFFDDTEARRIAGFVESMGRLGISADLDDIDIDVVLIGEDGEPIGDGDGEGGESDDLVEILLPVELPEGVEEQLRVVEGRIMGGTVTPFPAFAEAFIELRLEGPGGQGDEPGDQSEGDAPPNEGVAAAGAPRAGLPAAWFSDPGFAADHDDPAFRPVEDPVSGCLSVPVTITDDGRIFGHLASWGSCHVGFPDECVSPPSSAAEYAYFRTGTVETDDGQEVPVGQITMGTGHENDLSASYRQAAAHYDNTGTAVADIAVGEDEYGIWVAGSLREGVTDEQLRILRASGSLSGDWRPIRGNLELVAALAVNVPGFPVPRARVAAGGEVLALVAAGAGSVARASARRNAPVSRAEYDAVVGRLEAVERRMPLVAALEPLARSETQKRLSG